MIAKAEQDRIKALLRDTITLLCKNGLTFKAEFSIEALIGITLDHDDVVLVSINEQIKPEKFLQRPPQDSTDDESIDWTKPLEIAPHDSFSSHSRSGGDRNHHRRRRRKRPHVKVEQNLSDEDEHQQNPELLDLSTDQLPTSENQPPIKRSNSQDLSAEDDHKESVIVKRELADENWPPAGVVQEVTVGGSDSGNSDQPMYPPMYSSASFFPSSMMSKMSGMNPSMDSPGSSPKQSPHMPPIPMMNGLPFPPLPLPQSHFAQALGRLVGSVPPSLIQKMHHSVNTPTPKNSVTPSKSNSSPSNAHLYQPTSRSSLPKEAVALMTEWLRKNMHNPYPTDDIKDDFVQKTGLSFNQINYWFTNARRRLLPKWEMQRNLREQEMVQHISHQMGGTPPSSSSPRPSQVVQQLAHQMGATPSSSSSPRPSSREMSSAQGPGTVAKGDWS